MKEITKQEWAKTHKDYKSIINGQKYVLSLEAGLGTCLVPVVVK